MHPIYRKLPPFALLLALVFALTATTVPAQQPVPLLPPPAAQPDQPAQPDPNQPEVLARGPVHEAYATTAEAPAATPVVAKQPPDPIEELPPDEKPDGQNVQWLPGYWHWDDDADRYIWISGFWRVAPPGRLWVAGSWREVTGGWQWVPGFWQEPAPQQPQQPQQPEIQYLPPPPDSVEVGPGVPAPTVTSFYVPGSWVWRGRFLWRPGFWIEHRPGWVWVPARYQWSPAGYVFVDGYWDYPLSGRGVLYAPVYFHQPVYVQPAFVYTPTYVVSEPCMVGALFVRRGCNSYYFGDYFAPRYNTIGFNAWCGNVGRNGGGFAVGFGVGRTWGYDPLWSYYSVHHRQNPTWVAGVGNLYGGRYRGEIARPPVTLVQQNTVINHITNVNVTNVTNNVTVVNRNVTVNNQNVTDVAMLAPAKSARGFHPDVKFQPISAQVRKEEAQVAQQTREVGTQRAKLETAIAPKGNTPVLKATDPPRTVKLDVPKVAVARAQVGNDQQAPPANPYRDLKSATRVDPKAEQKPDVHPVLNAKVEPRPVLKIDPKLEPKSTPKVDPAPMPKVEPKSTPKVDPVPMPKVEPKGTPKVDPVPTPKVEPKGTPKLDPVPMPKGTPNVEPKGTPKVEPLPMPKVEPKSTPKVEPLPKVNPPANPLPKVEPKLTPPKVEPKGIPKLDPVPMPKGTPNVEPKGTPKVEPLPKVNPPVNPLPKVNPPVNPPKVETKVEPKVMPPKVDPLPLPKVNPPVNPVVPPKIESRPPVNPVVPPKVEPLPKVNPPVNPNPVPLPKVNPPAIPKPVLPPKVDVRPNPVFPPKVDPQPARPPVVPPVGNAQRPPVVQPQPQPAPRQPVALPQPVPPRAPVVQPQPQPAPRQPVAQPPAQPRQPVVPPQPVQPRPPVAQPVIPKNPGAQPPANQPGVQPAGKPPRGKG